MKTRVKMHGHLLKVVAFGLLVYPRDDPAIEEEENIIFQKYNEPIFEEVETRDPRLVSEETSMQVSLQDVPGTSEDKCMSDVDVHCQPAESDQRFRRKIISKAEKTPQSHTAEEEGSTMAVADRERDYLWCIWNIFSFISVIRFIGKYLRNESANAKIFCAAEVPLPDSFTLRELNRKCLQVSSRKKCREEEFLEGLMEDLLESMRATSVGNGGMVIGDFQMIDGRNFIIPAHPYTFEYLLCNKQATDLLPDLHIRGRIKLVENKFQSDFPCRSPDANDMVCLLHGEIEEAKTKAKYCAKNSPFLSKSRLRRWIQSTVRDAWSRISHKYRFELITCYSNATGTLEVRFQSGKKIRFNIRPVFKLDTDSYFYSSPSSSTLDEIWTLSLNIYEDRLLVRMSKQLPENSCHIQTLEIVYFLHSRQAALSGSGALTAWHCKIALMHVLFVIEPSRWRPQFVAYRLRDLLVFIARSLREKLLYHILIGNTLAQKTLTLPEELTRAKPVNLFHPLVVHECIYRNTLTFFQEMLRNANVQILDYVGNFHANTISSR
uniref:inositol 1,4,5-trisphosphate receptor-interacting protein n=1 Tax=Doryrhamphus excisus TaxID=161450 RepID=UPI0025AE929B|nr:inositol 1,4,5-trisphosphate receptor-interacting protein [Doryrhamphus excisus]